MTAEAAIEAGATIGAGYMQYQGQREANRMNKKLAREQMQFQERMSSTAYQRAVADMKEAGINPMLAYMQGGASSPGGASAEMKNELGGAVSSAMEAKRLYAELDNLFEQNKNLKTQNKQIQSQVELNRALEKVANAEVALKHNSAKSIEFDNVARKNEADIEGLDVKGYKPFRALRMLQKMFSVPGKVVKDFFR